MVPRAIRLTLAGFLLVILSDGARLSAGPGQQASSPEATDSGQSKPVSEREADTAATDKEQGGTVHAKEKLQADKVVAQTARDAATAQQALLEHEARKAILEQDIDLENQQLQAARKLQDTLEESLQADQKALEETLASGSDSSAIESLRQKIQQSQGQLASTEKEIRQRSTRLAALQGQLSSLRQEEQDLAQEAEQKRQQVEAAARRSAWLDSPFNPENIQHWVVVRGPNLILVLLAMFVLRTLARLVSHRLAALIIRRSGGTQDEKENRARTLAGAFRYATTAAVMIGGALMFMQAAGMDITTLLGGAAVLGLAVAFGAQSLLKDYFCGFIVLLENQYSINDVVTIGDHSGLVEKITLRMTALRDLDGNLHFIPNGNIGSVTNMTHGWSRALFDVGIAYKEDVDQVMEVLIQIARGLRTDPAFADVILDDVKMLGVDQFADSAVIIKFFIKTKPLMQWSVKREMLRRIKRRFDELGIEIPFPHRTIYQHAVHADGDGKSPLVRGESRS